MYLARFIITKFELMGKGSFNNFSEGKTILDACCGSRMFWFDKQNKDTLYIDKRNESLTANDRTCKTGIRQIKIRPDLVADFTKMPFEDESFYLVVFAPPHLKKLGGNSWLAKKYGKLNDDWKNVLATGFKECRRVLKPNGTLIFKWNETDIKVSEIISIIGQEPLFGHKSGKMMNTHWLTFFKSVGKIIKTEIETKSKRAVQYQSDKLVGFKIDNRKSVELKELGLELITLFNK